MSEQLIPLSEEDRQVLTRKRKAFLIWALGLVILSLLLLSLLIVLHTFMWLVLIIPFSVGLLLMSGVRFYILHLFSKDLRASQKQMISGLVEAQDVDVTRKTNDDGSESDATYRFWIRVGGKKVTVTEDQYYQFKKGDLATAFITPHSETVLGVSKDAMRRPFS